MKEVWRHGGMKEVSREGISGIDWLAGRDGCTREVLTVLESAYHPRG